MNITQQLAGQIVAAKFDDMPASAVQWLKAAIMDEIGIAFLGYKIYGQPLMDFARRVGSAPQSTILGDGMKVWCGLAAGINAEFASSPDFNETGPGIHALSAIAETGIAVGEYTGASGKDVITAIGLAYELNGRFARNLRVKESTVHIFPADSRRHLNLNSAICAAKLLALNVNETCQTMGLAWTLIPPDMEFLLQTQKRKYYRSSHNLWTCELGVQSALLAQYGTEAPEDIIDWKGKEIYDIEKLISSKSPYYYVTQELCLKPWIGSYGFMGGIELAINLVKEHNLKPDDIDKVVFKASGIYSDPDNIFTNPEPENAWHAANSVPWSTANAILGYEAGVEWLDERSLRDPVRIGLAKKVSVVKSESPLVNEVSIVTKRKETYAGKISRQQYLGNPLRPMTKEQLEGKFIRNTAIVVGQSQGREMVKVLNSLEQIKDIKVLTQLYKPAG